VAGSYKYGNTFSGSVKGCNFLTERLLASKERFCSQEQSSDFVNVVHVRQLI
jgi:hypothetical protein